MIVAERLMLRAWREEDRAPFAAMSADPEVMATLGPVMSRAESDATIDRVAALEAEHGYTFWAMERLSDGRFLGWCGAIPGTIGPVAGEVEIGWRLARDAWGQGYASEAAKATVEWCFAQLPCDAVWAITSQGNHRSRAVMGRLGMRYRPECDFLHPKLAEDSPLRPHVAYSLARPERGPL